LAKWPGGLQPGQMMAVQDHVVAGVLLTKMDTFLTREEYQQLVYLACAPTRRTDKMAGPLRLLPPTILKPQPLWTGKQVHNPSYRHPTTCYSPHSLFLLVVCCFLLFLGVFSGILALFFVFVFCFCFCVWGFGFFFVFLCFSSFVWGGGGFGERKRCSKIFLLHPGLHITSVHSHTLSLFHHILVCTSSCSSLRSAPHGRSLS
jgi:RNA polymerase Rpb1, domain 3